MKFIQNILTFASAALLLSTPILAQTYSSCNPLKTTGCPVDPALGKSIAIDFTKGASDQFTASGSPTYSSSGVAFTVAKSGDAPTLTSKFYIMFGKVSITMKAAPGAGIVSTLVLQSDDLDEIDMEWLGADSSEVQTNYFGKGDVTTYNRGQYNPATGNQEKFITYTIEWTATQIIWSVGGSVIRVLTPATADTNQYPQTPMQVKFGSWSGGDSSNAAGTIAWARGPTVYSSGPYTMLVQSLSVTDYSTGTSYSYGSQTGNWQDIVANGGKINGNAGGAASTVAVANSAAATSASPSIPAGWPWVATTTLSTSTQAAVTVAGVPSGWTVTGTGKIVPASSAVASFPTSSSSAVPSPSLSFLLSSTIGPESSSSSRVASSTTPFTPTIRSTSIATSTSFASSPTTTLTTLLKTISNSISSPSSQIASTPTTTVDPTPTQVAAAAAPPTNTNNVSTREQAPSVFWHAFTLLCISGLI